MEELLVKWELSEYIQVFAENKITESTLTFLKDDQIKDLIGPIGDRVRFINHLENWMAVADVGQTDKKDIFVDNLNDSHSKIKSVSEFFNVDHDTDSLDSNMETDDSESVSNDTVKIKTSEKEDTLTLKNLLMKSHDGRGLLNMYFEDGKLPNSGRRKICNIIIQDLLNDDPSKTIGSSTLLDRAQEITKLFKKESIGVYFIPYCNDKKLKIKRCAKGKLYDCLQNRRRELRHSNVIPKKHENKDTNSQEDETDDSEDVSDALAWLQNSVEPWHIVTSKWIDTVKQRIQEKIDVHKYMEKYPALKLPRGHELLTEDFKHLYPSAVNKLHENFPLVKQKLFKLAVSKCQLTEIRDVLEQVQLLQKDDENHDEKENILAFMLLPLLIGNPSQKGKKQFWRPSKAEVKDGFIAHVYRAMDLQETIKNRKAKYLKYNLTFQPTIVIVGPNYMNIEKYYVVVNDIFFETFSILQTVDTCFKIYQALNCQYPTESVCVWTFVQKAFYRISTKWDKSYSTVNALMTDLEVS